jgi:hypothetical protein
MAWTRVLIGVALFLLAACSTGGDAGPSATHSPAAAERRRAPYRLTAGEALRAVRSTKPVRGLRISQRCDSRRDRSCVADRWRGSRWLVGWAATGAPLPEGNGLHEYARVVMTAWPSPAVARGALREARHDVDRFRGEYYVPLKEIGPNRYIPGDRGKGDVQRVSLRQWRGIGVRKVFFLYFDTYDTTGTVFGGRFVLRRGPYVVDVEWVARRRATDRRLSHLPARLIRSLR